MLSKVLLVWYAQKSIASMVSGPRRSCTSQEKYIRFYKSPGKRQTGVCDCNKQRNSSEDQFGTVTLIMDTSDSRQLHLLVHITSCSRRCNCPSRVFSIGIQGKPKGSMLPFDIMYVLILNTISHDRVSYKRRHTTAYGHFDS